MGDPYEDALAQALAGEDEEEEGFGGTSAIGRQLFDPDTFEFLGTLHESPATGRLFILPAPGTGRQPIPFSGGVFGTALGSHMEIDQFGNARQTRTMPRTAGGGGGGLSVADQIRLMEEEARIARAEGDWARARDYENQVDFLKMQQAYATQERKAEEQFTLRLNQFQAANELARQLMAQQVEARETAIREMGQDPWLGAILAQGGVPVGQSPHRRLREELFGFAGAEIPQVGIQAPLEESQAAIERMGGMIEQFPRRPIGLASGGIVEMERENGRYTMTNRATGQKGDAILVGESGTPEVVEMLSSGRLRVIPLAGRAQEGGEYDFTPTQTGEEARIRAQALLPLWRALGLADVPIGSRLPAAYGGMMQAPLYGSGFGWPTRDPTRAAETFQALGVRPRIFWEPDKGVFLIGRPSGELQVIGPPDEARRIVGEGIAQAVVMPTSEIVQLGYRPSGQALAPESVFGDIAGRWAPRQPIYAPLTVEEDIGLFLPDPRMLASAWRELDPDTKAAAISAYDRAGVSEEQLMERMGFYTPRGLATAAGTARLA